MGRTIEVLLSDYHPLQAGQPTANAVSVRQRLLLLGMPGSHTTSVEILTLSKLERQNNVPWPFWRPKTSWRLQKESHHQLRAGEAQQWQYCLTGVQTTIKRQPLSEQIYTFFWQGKVHDEPWRNSLLTSVELPSKGTARILSLCLSTSSGPVNILSIYAPILDSAAETKDVFRFYVDLETTIRQIPSTEQIYLLGDFNVRIGTVQESWHRNIGHFGVSRLYEKGHRLLKVCSS